MTRLHKIFARRTFAKVLMAALLIGGWISLQTIPQEYLPDRSSPLVQITVDLPGAPPEDIETALVLPIENAIRGIGGIERVEASAVEGRAVIRARLLRDADRQKSLSDIKNAVDRIETLPETAERPTVSIPVETEKVMSLIVHGEQPVLWLRRLAEQVRRDLTSEFGLTKVALSAPREIEVSVEVSEETLRAYSLTLGNLAEIIGQNTSDIPGGTLFTDQSDISIRTIARRDVAREFRDISILEDSAGQSVRLSEIATIVDGFGVSPIEAWFNGEPAIQIDVYAVGSETPLSVEETVLAYLDQVEREQRYQGATISIFENDAQTYRERMELLVDNAVIGLLLVLLVLALFLKPRIAFWVMMGIPTALLGSFLLLPLFGATVNMISLFAFIVTIGVVVDDAIMMGEAIFQERCKGHSGIEAAVRGAKRMGIPILIAVSTTMIAFLPMFFIPGSLGALFSQISAVVVAVLLVSLVEVILILTVHLATDAQETRFERWLSRPQNVVNAVFARFTQTIFRNLTRASIQRPFAALAAGVSLLLVTVSAITAGWLSFSFTPTIQSDTVVAQVTLPYGAPRQDSLAVQATLVESARSVLEETSMKSPGTFSLIGAKLDEGEVEASSLVGSHYISVLVSLPPLEDRTVSGAEFAARWQSLVGPIMGAEAISFTGESSATGGEPVQLDLYHPDPRVAEVVATKLSGQLQNLAGLASISDGMRAGKPEYQIIPRAHAARLGLSDDQIGNQVRERFHGAEALRIARDGNEVKVMVRLSERERQSLAALRVMQLQTPSGALVPLSDVADFSVGRSVTSLNRRDGQRVVSVTAEMLPGADEDTIEDAIHDSFVPALVQQNPGLVIGVGGEEEEIEESLSALGSGFLYALLGIGALLILYFNTVRHALIVLSVIPFALIGAVWGHIGMGYDLSVVSIIGIIAMAGVVVNDSVVLVGTYRDNRAQGLAHRLAIALASCDRLRPILLTSLTTFFGLLPMMLETSEQAQFLIPMAISIGFGLLAATLIVLVLVPALLSAFGDAAIGRLQNEMSYADLRQRTGVT